MEDETMLRILIAVCAVFCLVGCASTVQYVPMPDQNVSIQDPSKCRVYVYRPAIVGAAIPMSVSDNGLVIGQTGPKGYLCWERAPGFFVVKSEAENTDGMPITGTQGETYYLFQHVRMGLVVARSELERVQPEQGKADLRKCSPASAPVR